MSVAPWFLDTSSPDEVARANFPIVRRGFDPVEVRVPVLVVHGGQDRVVPSSHGRSLAGRIPSAELWRRPEDGHVSVLGSAEAALGCLREQTGLG